MLSPALPALSDVDGFWSRPLGERSEAFTRLRATPEIPFYPEPTAGVAEPGPGYYALTRLDDIVEASRRPAAFRSEPDATSIPDVPEELAHLVASMINMDDPRHGKLRRLVARGFTPRRLAALAADVERIATSVVDDIAERGSCDVVTDVAARLPLRIVSDMMGIPASEYAFVLRRTNIMLGATDPEYAPDGDSVFGAQLRAGRELTGLMQSLAERRRRTPGDDLTSVLVHAEVDGERLTDDEIASFFILLVVAGNETTTNAITWGVHLLDRHPDQRAALLADPDALLPGAVEEIVRWASPIIYMRRTLAGPAVLSGQELPAGAKVVMFYWSGNRDERHFADPDAFDIRRRGGTHVGFGGPGPHFCLGAHLARREVSVMLRELLGRLPDLRTTAEPDRLVSMFLNGVKHLPAEFTPRAPRRA